ncbi:MAG: LamG-like jellyroll fold domain-containing protein, partial [Phycisphaerae bacterium]
APSAGPGAGARTVINVPDVSIDYAVGLQGTLEVPASATIHNIEDFGPSDANTLFQIGAGQTLTIDGDETLDNNRIWNVVGGATLLYSGDLTTAYTLRKAGAGTFTLAGANNSIASLIIGTSPGGTVIVTAAGKIPDSVLIEAGSLYTVQKDNHNYDEVAAASAGIAALSSGSNANVNFSDNAAYLGALGDYVFDGNMTPGAGGYFFGGGGGRLTVNDIMSNVPGPNTPATLGWADSHDNNVLFAEGVVLLNAENKLTGDVQVHMETIYLQKAFELVEPTDGNWVYVNAGGMLDLNSTGAREDNIMMNGGGLANTGGTLDANKMFPGPTGDYIIGSNSAGKTSWVDGGFVRANASLWKIGSDTAVLLDPIGGGDSNNTYAEDVADPNVIRGHTTIVGGTLEIYNTTSLAHTGALNIQNGSSLIMRSAGSLDAVVSLNGTLEIQDAGLLDLTDANAGLALAGTSLFAGGGTIELGAHTITGSGSLEIGDAGTVSTTINANSASDLFVIDEGSTAKLRWDGSFAKGLGTMYPGGTLQIESATGANARATHNTGKLIDLVVDEEAWLADRSGASSPANPYKIVVDGGGDGFFGTMNDWTVDRSGLLSTPAVVDDGNGLVHHPVAYIEKTGPGMLGIGGSLFGDANAIGGKAYWIVKEGDLGVIQMHASLGGTAGTWAIASGWTGGWGPDDVPYNTEIAYKNLEGIELYSGTSLTWAGPQGFLSDTVWRADPNYAHEPGNGWNPGEFIMENGSALYAGWIDGTDGHRGTVGNYDYLDLGIVDPQDANDVYLAYPSLRSTDANLPTVTFGGPGTLRLRSGVDANTLNANGSTYHAVIDGGRVEFSSDLPDALPADNIRTLTIMNAGTAALSHTHAAVTETTIEKFATLEFDANATTSYSGTVFSDGAVRVRTGQVDLGTTIIGSSPIGAAYDLIDGNFTGQYWGNQTETILKNVDWGALGDPNFTRGDAVVDFMNDASFNLQSGDPNMANDYFTVRWTVDLNVGADEAGLFEFWTDSDDASVVWVDDEIVVDNDGDHGPRTARGSVLLDEGIHTLVMGMHETAGGARARLGWNVYGVGDAIFDGNGVNLSGLINVDAGATLRLGGFNDAGVVTVDGNMVINGTAVSTAHELIINNGGVLDLGDGTISPVTNGTIRGTLLANGSLARFENVTIEGTSPAINLGTGLLRATNATVNSDFAFGVGVKSAFDTLAVNANVSVIPGGELAVSSMATISGGSKLSLSGGDTASLEAVMIDGGELEISDGNGLNSGMGVHNDGVVRITNGAVVDLTDVVITSSMSSGALPRATRLQAHWRFEDNLSDSSGNNRDGTMQGGAAVFVAGQVGQALSFDGTDDHVDIVGYPGVTGTQARTLSAWVQTSNNDTAFLGWGLNNNSEKWVFRVQTGNGTPGAIRVEVNGGYITGDTDIRGTGWRHVVAVLPDGSNNVDQVLLYLDGQLQGTSAVLSNPINTSAGGVVEIGNDVQNRYFGGLMDEVAIWDVALTPAQIQALYNWGGVIGNITVDAGSKLKVGGFTDAGTVTPAGTLELHNPLVTSTAELVAVPDGGVMDIRGSSLDANFGSLGGTLLGDGTALAKFRTRLTVEDATSPSINLGGGQLQVPGEVLVKKDNFAFDGGHVASIGTLNMEGPISVRIESTGNVSADLVNVGEAQTLVLKGGMLDPGRIENSNGHVHVQSGMNDLSDTVIHSPGGTLVPPVITGVDIGDSVAPGGSDTPIGGQWTDAGGSITGTGPDVWGGADDFHFVYREFDIDDDFDVRVDMSTFYGPGTNGWRKGGIMLRDSVADNSVYVAALGTPSNGTRIQWREGGSDSTPDSSNGHNNATSLRLVKNGTSFDAYHGTFGMDDWTLIASQAVTAWTNDTVLLGLWVTSHQDGVEATADFTNATLFAQDFYPVGTEIYGDLTIDSGAVLKLKGFTNAGTVQVGAAARLELGQYDSNCLDLELDPMGLIDVGQSLLIMRDGNTLLADVVGDIQTGRNGGGWDGANWVGGNWNGTAGITSSSLAGHEAEWSLAAFDPNTLNSDDEILVRLTIIGDVDVDEDVDEDDRAILEANFDQAGTWGDGDLDYSGIVDFRDYLLWKAFEGQEYDGPGSTIPEPATLVLLAFGGVAVLARRRRRK